MKYTQLNDITNLWRRVFWCKNSWWKSMYCKYVTKEVHVNIYKPTRNRNNITCGCKTCIIAMILQSDLNKLRLSQLFKLDKIYINSTWTRLLQISNNYFIEYKNLIFPNNSHINLRACDAASSYHCTSPSTGSNIPKWDCILNCCFDCLRMNSPYL